MTDKWARLMYIEEYQFGRITIDGETYTRDVIILPDRVLEPWWRRSGHRLDPQDLDDALAAGPEIIMVGTGWSGAMSVPPETVRFLEERGIRVLVKTSKEAVSAYNGSQERQKIVLALHLTC